MDFKVANLDLADFGRTEIGLGSAISVLLFLAVLLICFIFIKGFRTDLSKVRGA